MKKILLSLTVVVTLLVSGCGTKPIPKVVDQTEIPIQKILEREDLSDDVKAVIQRGKEAGVTGMTEEQITATIQQAAAKAKSSAEAAENRDSANDEKVDDEKVDDEEVDDN